MYEISGREPKTDVAISVVKMRRRTTHRVPPGSASAASARSSATRGSFVTRSAGPSFTGVANRRRRGGG
jgi:hypothetical protein